MRCGYANVGSIPAGGGQGSRAAVASAPAAALPGPGITALEHALLDEAVESLGQALARDAKVGLDLVETVHPDPYITQDQW
jgi:hypothetical protein